MATDVVAGPLGELRGAGASKGTALTTTATFIQLPLRSSHIFITPRNFSTAVVARFFLNPWLVVIKTTNTLAQNTNSDFSNAAQDAEAATDVVLSALNTVANGHFILVGSHRKFRGAYAAVGGANAIASTLTVAAWDGAAWASVSASDGTASGGATLAASGLVSWTVPSAWPAVSLKEIYGEGLPDDPATAPYRNIKLFWTRWSVSATLTDPTTLDSLVAANRSTAYFESLSGQTLEQRILHGLGGMGCVEALTDAGTANLIVNVATLRDGRFE